MKPETLARPQAELRLEDYFLGRTLASGLFQDRSGAVRREFELVVDGSLTDDVLTLAEDFLYDDGAQETRTWRIRRNGQGYEATADDVLGTAHATADGRVVTWDYRFALKAGGRTWPVRFADRMILKPGGLLLNRATVSKFGLRLGEVTCAFRKG